MTYIIKKIYKKDYPLQLQQLTALPKTMDIVGTMPGPENKFLCVIGSRNHSSYGKEVCQKLISGLARRPIVIVSGLAIGIDSLAHESALKAGLKTIAFPGSGLLQDVLYPYSRRNLALKIVEAGGALVSPFEANQCGADWTFPRRNQLMAGISHATLIIEGGHGSGTLLTTQNALDYSRDVLAVPGQILDELAYGPNMLIRRGATPITCSNDILEALDFDIDANQPINFDDLSLTPEQKRIIAELQISPLSSTALTERTDLPIHQFNIIATELELLGVLMQVDGVYKLKH
jgi:DNA processing protein